MKKENKTNIFRFLICLPLAGWLITASAAAAEFIEGMEDIPAAPAMQQVPGNDVSFGNDESRFVEAYLSGKKASFKKVSDFYLETLPQLGWHFTGQDKNSLHFERDDERLDIVREKTAPLLIRITLKSKN